MSEISNDKVKDDAKIIWEKIEAFSESMLGDGPFSVFKTARETEPTKTMLAKEKEYAVKLIAEYIEGTTAAKDTRIAELEKISRVLLDTIGDLRTGLMTGTHAMIVMNKARAALERGDISGAV